MSVKEMSGCIGKFVVSGPLSVGWRDTGLRSPIEAAVPLPDLDGQQHMAGKSNFERLRVYRLSEEIADRIWVLVIRWNPLAKDTLGRQLIRAADSIGANIAEGAGRGSFQDNRRFIRIARGSLNETRHFLRRAHFRKLLSETDTAELKPLIDELSPRLNSYLRSVGPSAGASTTDNGQRTTGPDRPPPKPGN